MKKCWKVCLVGLLALCLLAGCGAPAVPERQPLAPTEKPTEAPTQPVTEPATEAPTEVPTEAPTEAPTEVPTEAPTEAPTETPTEAPTEETVEWKCTLTIRCDKLIGNPDLDPDKAELVPADGILFTAEAEFSQGESVFNVLQRTLKQHKQHLEFEQTPLYNSAYIEGICNLYAFDAGALSGWMYSVNDTFPNYGCSQYTVQPGDVIEWHYTCDLGADLGAEGASGNNQ